MHVQGKVQTTIVGGTVVFQDDEIVGKPGAGMIMKRGAPGSSL